MAKFVINQNRQANGDHEVHNESTGCLYMPNPGNQVDLGYHNSCQDAVSYAKRENPNHRINGCFYCCKPCHTS
jgi:hypothetical protein